MRQKRFSLTVFLVFYLMSLEVLARGASETMQQQAAQQSQGVNNEQTPEIAALTDVIAALNLTAQNWTLLVDPSAKETVVSYYIHQFQEQGIGILKPAEYYVNMIDGMSQQSPDMLKNPFVKVLQMVAVIEYDFNNGQNPDDMAYQILGSKEAVMQNRQRLGM